MSKERFYEVIPTINENDTSNGFMWICDSNDGAFEDESKKVFSTLKECYYDMRDSALEKAKWNTMYEDFDDIESGEFIGYNIRFYKNMIVHESYSGEYLYRIVRGDWKEYNNAKDILAEVKKLFDGKPYNSTKLIVDTINVVAKSANCDIISEFSDYLEYTDINYKRGAFTINNNNGVCQVSNMVEYWFDESNFKVYDLNK